MIKKMIVYAPERKFELFHSRYDIERVNVTCRAIGVYPEPSLALYNESGRLQDPVIVRAYKFNNLYDVITTALIHDSELNSPTTFDCELVIPNTPYTKRKTLHYYPGSTESLSSVSDSGTHTRCKPCTCSRLLFVISSMYFVCTLLLKKQIC